MPIPLDAFPERKYSSDMDNEARKFLASIEAFCAEHGMPVTTFGRLALSDFAFVSRLRAGRSPSLRTVGRCLEFMADYGKPKKRRKRPLAELAA